MKYFVLILCSVSIILRNLFSQQTGAFMFIRLRFCFVIFQSLLQLKLNFDCIICQEYFTDSDSTERLCLLRRWYETCSNPDLPFPQVDWCRPWVNSKAGQCMAPCASVQTAVHVRIHKPHLCLHTEQCQGYSLSPRPAGMQ